MQEIDGALLIINTLNLEITPEIFLKKAHILETTEMLNTKCMSGKY